MKFAHFLALIYLTLASFVAVADESRTETLRFAKGATGTSVTSSITGYNSVNYKLTAKAGQHMVIKLSTSNTATYFNIYAPGSGPGDEAMYIGSISGDRFSGQLPDSGTYTVQIYMMRSAARRNETANYKLRVDIDNGKSSHERSRGKNGIAWAFDARGNLPCSAGEPSFQRQCAFEVKRQSGAAEIRTRKPLTDQGQRVLYFDNNQFSTNDQSPLNWQRQGDNWWLAAGSREYYLIPDAVIYGG